MLISQRVVWRPSPDRDVVEQKILVWTDYPGPLPDSQHTVGPRDAEFTLRVPSGCTVTVQVIAVGSTGAYSPPSPPVTFVAGGGARPRRPGKPRLA